MHLFTQSLGDNGAIKFSEYTGTLSSTSSGHSNDRWSETTPDEPPLTKPSLTTQFPSASSFPSLRQSPYSQSDRDYSPPPPLPVRYQVRTLSLSLYITLLFVICRIFWSHLVWERRCWRFLVEIVAIMFVTRSGRC